MTIEETEEGIDRLPRHARNASNDRRDDVKNRALNLPQNNGHHINYYLRKISMTSLESPHFISFIWPGFLTTISGIPLYCSIEPDTHILLFL